MAKIKQRNNKGLVLHICVGVFFIALGIFMYMLSNDTVENLLDKKQTYTDSYSATQKGEIVVATIVAASEPIGVDESSKLYLIQTDKDNVLFLETRKEDDKLEKLDKEDGTLTKPYQFIAKHSLLVSDDAKALKEFLEENEVDSTKVNTRSVLSIKDYEEDKLYSVLMSAGLGLVGVVSMGIGIFKRKKNVTAYTKLYALYPELKQDLTLLQTQGTYYNDIIQTGIYKEHILFMKNGFELFKLDEIVWIGYTVTTVTVNGVPSKTWTFDVLAKVNETPTKGNELKEYTVSQGKYKKKLEEPIQELLAFVLTNYPHIKVGEDDKKQFTNVKGTGLFGNKKQSIDEFLEEKERETVASIDEVVETDETKEQEN